MTTSPKIVYLREGYGMGDAGMILDSKERALAGDCSYVINVPKKAYCDQSLKIPQIEEVDHNTYSKK